MSFYSEIKTALQTEYPDIPFSTEFHNEKYDEYFTITLPYTNGTEFADDTAGAEVSQIYLHWFMPEKKNFLEGRKQICKVLEDLGFTYPRTQVLSESETHVRHVVFEIYNFDTL